MAKAMSRPNEIVWMPAAGRSSAVATTAGTTVIAPSMASMR